MAENSVEERMLELIEEICDDEIIREERDVDLFEAVSYTHLTLPTKA